MRSQFSKVLCSIGVVPLSASSKPQICASCRIYLDARQATIRQTKITTRGFSTTPRRRERSNDAANASASSSDAAEEITHYDFFPQTFPNGAPPRTPFSPDLRQLRKEFLQLQAKAHPDLAPADQKRRAEALSMRINEAYKTLQDPLRRAQYLLQQQGIDTEDENAKLSENELLMEVMEAREAVEEVENEEDLHALRDENNMRIQQSVQTLDQAFANTQFEEAAREAVRLRYWMNIEESIAGWEKGRGGGAIHH